jgi:hypothetical protein
MKIVSTMAPCIVRWPDGRREIMAGTIISVDGTPRSTQLDVPADFELSSVEWCRHLATKPANTPIKTHVIDGSNGDTHVVTTYENGTTRCTCKGYQYRKTCRHLKL